MAQPNCREGLLEDSKDRRPLRRNSPKSRRQVSQADVVWADVIFLMEHKHKSRLAAEFNRAMQYKTVHVLDIPDDYRFMDPELVDIFERAVPPLLH